jgi:hypothetical protein
VDSGISSTLTGITITKLQGFFEYVSVVKVPAAATGSMVTFGSVTPTYQTTTLKLTTDATNGDRITIETSGFYAIKLYMQCLTTVNAECYTSIVRNPVGTGSQGNIAADIILSLSNAASNQYAISEYNGYLYAGDQIGFQCSDGDYGQTCRTPTQSPVMTSAGFSFYRVHFMTTQYSGVLNSAIVVYGSAGSATCVTFGTGYWASGDMLPAQFYVTRT